MTTPHPRLFAELRTRESRLETLPADVARCLACWELKLKEDFSREHIPPQAVELLTGEGFVPDLLTCKACNSSAGKDGQDDLKKLIQFQKWSAGNYDDRLPAELTFIQRGRKLRANVTWTTGRIYMVGVPKANNPDDTQDLSDHPLEDGETWEVSGVFHNPQKAAWALLHSAYLLLVARSEYRYAYRPAGAAIRRLLTSPDLMAIQNYCFPATELPIPCPVGVVSLQEPKGLSCYIVKIAGQFMLMPLENDDVELYEKWWWNSSVTKLTLRPNACRMRITTDLGGKDLLEYVPIR